jgi:manganese efflux pump family protein
MSFVEILLIAVGLAMDAFAVSLGVGAAGQATRPRPIFRLSFHFGLFQALMPVLGWLAGTRVANLISGVDHWLALALLSFVGIRMIKSGFDPNGDCAPADASRGGTLIILCVATSIDAFAVGLSMAMLHVQILYPSAVIGVVTVMLSLLALLVGGRLGKAFGKRMEIVGGLILVGIGLRVVLTHLL